MPAPTNVERAGRAAQAVDHFGSIVYGAPDFEPLDQTMSDLIANMQHLARFDEENWELMLHRATARFAEEVASEPGAK